VLNVLDQFAGGLQQLRSGEVVSPYGATITPSTTNSDFESGDTIRYIGEYEVIEEIARGVDPLADQGWAGIVMMFESTAVTVVVLTWLFLLWARQDIERQELLDYAADRGVELEPDRAGRAVAAGQAERLRERIGSTEP